MGKKSRSKKAIKIDKQKIRDILSKQKDLNKKNAELLSEKRENMISSKNMVVDLEKVLKKKISKNKIVEEKEETKEIKKPTLNLFTVKKYENEDSERETLKDKDLNDLGVVKEIREEFVDENPFKNNEEFIFENLSEEEEFNSEEEERDIHLKALVSSYDPVFEEINKLYDVLFAGEKMSCLREKMNFKKLDRENSARGNEEIGLNEEWKKEQRGLPIAEKEYELIEKIYQNPVTIVCGETGSGKSTQLPKYLFEGGFAKHGIIGVTQPRRIATISLAYRVGEESNLTMGSEIGYQVRFEKSKFSDSNRIKFMTDGILLNEMMSDFLLSKYSVIIIDEAHERKLATDILIGLLSKVIKIRARKALEQFKAAKKPEDVTIFPLRLVIMSATLRVRDFLENQRLFETPPPLVNIQVRTFPVNVFFNKITPDNYFENILQKVKKIHLNLPKGGILVFLTGKDEVNRFCQELHDEMKFIKKVELPEEEDLVNGKIDLDNLDALENPGEDDQSLLTEEFEYLESSIKKKGDKLNYFASSTYEIFPLYSKLPVELQQKIFQSDPEKRLIVVSTNVAETSLTINGLKYLLDCGKEKNKYVDLKSGVTKYSVDFITQSSAEQRKGRVGRTNVGYCYRIYSPAVFKNMKKYKKPEILKLPLNYSILQLAKIGMRDIEEFPFPSIPDPQTIKESLETLLEMKLLEKIQNSNKVKITKLGETLSFIPLEPHLSIILLKMRRENILHFGIVLVGLLACEELFDFGKVELPKEEKFKFFQKFDRFLNNSSDLITLINILGNFFVGVKKQSLTNFRVFRDSEFNDQIKRFSQEMNINEKIFKEYLNFSVQVFLIFKQLLNETELEDLLTHFTHFKNVNKQEERILIRIISESFENNIAKKRVLVVDENKSRIRFETLDFREANFFKNSFVKKNSSFYIYQTILEIEGKYFLKNITKVLDYSILMNLDKKRITNVVSEKRLVFDNKYETVYDAKDDKVLSYYKYYFGPFKWETPVFLHDVEFDEENKYTLFLISLLRGQVFFKLKTLSKCYKTKIAILNENFVKTDPSFVRLIKFFQENSIFNKKSFSAFYSHHTFKILFLDLFHKKLQDKISSLFSKIFE